MPNKCSLVHYPADRRLIVRPKMRVLAIAVILILTPIILAWIQYAIWGRPILPMNNTDSESPAVGFPGWIRLTHFVNFFFLILLVRSGLQILIDHPRLYWNVHSTPGTEWIRFTPLEVPRNKFWTARDDSRYLSPWIGLPGYRHTVGMARHWHFMSVLFWLINGLVFALLLLTSNFWKRIIPQNLQTFKTAWVIFVHYANLKPHAKFVVCWSFGEGLEGGRYYAAHSIEESMQEQTILAYEMNKAPLIIDYGAPLRIRIENKLGFKMVKWIESIEFVESYKQIEKGEGGKSEDDEYFGFSAEI